MKGFLPFILTLLCAVMPSMGADLVLLTTNDTHSNIDHNPDGSAGILERAALIDSVRAAEKNVILIDAGDMVQGSLYFKYFRGDVEYPLLDMMKYDIRILGNHEFDNGLDELAANWKKVKGARLSANYDFTGTVAEGIFEPYVIKKVAGKKIGFFGINVDPYSLIVADNYKGMKFKDIIATANEQAKLLRKKGCDLVVAVTHIGYKGNESHPGDVELAKASEDIDIIIGGHSHTFVDPAQPDVNPHYIDNAKGKKVLVTQTGKYGKNVGYIKINLNDLKSHDYIYKYLPVTDRFAANGYNKEMMAFLAPYRQKVDSVNNNVIAVSEMDAMNMRNGAFANWAADFGMWFGRHVVDSLNAVGANLPAVDLSIMNVGGIRHPMKKGAVTEGQILSTFPFSNRMQLIKVKGRNIIDALKVTAAKGGEAVSENIRGIVDADGNLVRLLINGEEMGPDKDYIVSTIDYVAQGNDGLIPLADHELIWSDGIEMSVPMLRYVRHLTELGMPVIADPNGRFIKQVSLN